MRKYADLWKRIANRETVSITCPIRGVKAISAAIYNEKYLHQKARKATDLPGYGRVQILQTQLVDDKSRCRLTISIAFSGDNL